MSKEFRGFVRRVFTKEGTGRNGKPYKLYSFKLATPEGKEDPTWYQLGFDAPNVKADYADDKYGDGGSYVKFTATVTDDGKSAKVDESSLKKLKNPPARQPVEAPQGGGKGGYKGGKGSSAPKFTESKLFGKIGGYNTEDDVRRMSYANARGDALAAIEILLANDALAISGAKTKAGQVKRFAEIVAMIDKLTVKYFFDSASGRQLALVADELVKEPTAQGDLPEDDEEADSVEDNEDSDAESDDEEDVEDSDEEVEDDEEDSDDEEEEDDE